MLDNWKGILVAVSATFLIETLVPNSAGAKCTSFDDYPVTSIFKGPFKAPNTSHPKIVHRFRTVIKLGAKGPPNYAGHFKFVEWGCGSSCHAYAAVDLKTGKVYPFPFVAGLGVEYKSTSRLAIADGPDLIEDVYGAHLPKDGSIYKSAYYLWDENKEQFIELPPCGY